MVTTHLHRVRIPSILKWVSLGFPGSNLRSSRTTFWPTGYHILHCLRSYGRKKSASSENGPDFGGGGKENATQLSRAALKEAQVALQEYLHSTRSLQFVEAEYISRNSPCFLGKLLKKVNNDKEIGRSMARFLRYHPINEFEPFFESIGLKPAEYGPLLPRKLMYLNDDVMLLENYQVLCNYGVGRNNIGRIYKEATEAFKFDNGVLQSKLRALEDIGLSQSTVVKFVSSRPSLLIGEGSRELSKVLDGFKSFGIEYGWIEANLVEGNSYNFTHMLQLLYVLGNMGCSEEQLGKLFFQHPGLLFEDSGNPTISLIGFLLKFGSTKKEIYSLFLEFPRIKVGHFVSNLRKCYNFLVEIEMEVQDIGRIVHSHPLLLGSCCLKKLDILLADLDTGKKELCDAVKEDLRALKGWVIGSKVKQVSDRGAEELRSKMMKMKFLLDLGFVENSNEMRKALKLFRGKGGELQGRFDCFVKAGLDGKDVSEMIKVAPQVLNQSEEVIKMKLDFLVNDLGYPLSALLAYPAFVSYTIQRVKLRLSMYDWLKEQKIVQPNLSMSTVIGCSDKIFIKLYVNKHPGGPKIWEELRLKRMKMKFLLDLGFVENSKEMTKALKVFRGKGGELQERFDCFVKAGLDRKDVLEMIKEAPQVLNQSAEVIKRKMDFLVNGLGYPVSSLLAFPTFVSYTIQRVKLRLSMYDWLKEQKTVRPNLSMSTIIGSSDDLFIKVYVNKHPGGPKIWENLKKEILPD